MAIVTNRSTTPGSTNDPALELMSVNVRLGRRPVLNDVSFAVPHGKVTSLLGPNGSGKTTLLRAVAGILDYEGSIKLREREVRSLSPREVARQLAFVRQLDSAAFDFSVSEIILLGRSPHKSMLSGYDSADLSVCREALQSVGLAGFEDRAFLELSGGERQRVYLAQALAQRADVLLLDEPTAHLDVRHRFETLDLLHDIVGGGVTALIVMHDIELAVRYSDHVVILHEGAVVGNGQPREVVTSAMLKSVFGMLGSVEAADMGLRVSFTSPAR